MAINQLNLKFLDQSLEKAFRLRLTELELKFVKYFILLLIFFNGLYVIKDFFFPTTRALISIQFQAFLVIPVNIALLFISSSNRFRTPYSRIFGFILFFFTFYSQLFIIVLNDPKCVAISSVMLIVLFACYSFSGMIYKHLLIITPLIAISIGISLLFICEIKVPLIINYSLLYTMLLLGVLLIKYQTENHQRRDFLKSEIIKMEGKKLKDSLEQVNALSDLRKNIISVLAHDVRAPIGDLQSILNLTKSNMITIQESEQNLTMLEHQVKKVNFLVNDILVWVKNQTDEIRLERIHFDLSNCLEDLHYIFKDSLAEKTLNLEASMETTNILCQPEMMKAVLRNLIGNAIKFSRNHSKITLRTERVTKGIKISVEDEGIGMNSESLARLQHSFASDLGTNMEEGTGLGLKICQALVKTHQSELKIESEPDAGTKVSFELMQESV